MELEINLLGTGGGYGESVVIHLGNQDWVIIDSCIEPSTGEVLPLAFLRSRNIDLSQVKLIICTHWHDDHIGGISDILKSCQNAIFSYARVNDLVKFLQFVSLDYQKLKTTVSNTSTAEFNRCLEILLKSGRIQKFAASDKMLYSDLKEGFECRLYSLSPSDKSTSLFDQEVSTLIDKFGSTHKRIPRQTANDRSVVILINVNDQVIILGADLEVVQDDNLGWLDIINNSSVIKLNDKASYFKVPHHGSENGYHDSIWSVLIKDKPIGTLTPWNRNTKLPQPDMVERYKSLTNELYITSPLIVSNKAKKRDHKTEKTIKEFNNSVRELKFQFGVISSTLKLDGSSDWITVTQGTSFLIK